VPRPAVLFDFFPVDPLLQSYGCVVLLCFRSAP
jgi:hypothetical protein